MRSHNNWALYSTALFTGTEICRVTFVSDFRCIQKARRKKVFVCCKDSVHKIVHSFVSSVSNCGCRRVLYSPLTLTPDWPMAPFYCSTSILTGISCVCHQPSHLAWWLWYTRHLSSLFMSQFYFCHRKRDGLLITQKLFCLIASAKSLKTHL